MLGLFSKAHPSFERLLVIESGPRRVTEQFLAYLYAMKRSQHVDLLTCFADLPAAFDSARGTFYQTGSVKESRARFIRQLAHARYPIIAILCTGSPILAKWKWTIALRTRAKILIVNEHAGFFFLDIWHIRTAKLMLSQRLRVPGAIQPGLLAELLLVPFSISYLLLYAGYVHMRRLLRML